MSYMSKFRECRKQYIRRIHSNQSYQLPEITANSSIVINGSSHLESDIMCDYITTLGYEWVQFRDDVIRNNNINLILNIRYEHGLSPCKMYISCNNLQLEKILYGYMDTIGKLDYLIPESFGFNFKSRIPFRIDSPTIIVSLMFISNVKDSTESLILISPILEAINKLNIKRIINNSNSNCAICGQDTFAYYMDLPLCRGCIYRVNIYRLCKDIYNNKIDYKLLSKDLVYWNRYRKKLFNHGRLHYIGFPSTSHTSINLTFSSYIFERNKDDSKSLESNDPYICVMCGKILKSMHKDKANLLCDSCHTHPIVVNNMNNNLYIYNHVTE